MSVSVSNAFEQVLASDMISKKFDYENLILNL